MRAWAVQAARDRGAYAVEISELNDRDALVMEEISTNGMDDFLGVDEN
jgi:hypothetical protein